MAIYTPIIDAFKRLGESYIKFADVRAKRSFLVRSRRIDAGIKHPDWQLVIVSTLCLIGLSMLLLDDAAGHWKSTVSAETYQFFRQLTRLGKSEVLLVPAALAILSLGLLSWKSLSRSAVASLVQFQLLGLFVFIAIAGSGISNNILKMLFGRARPRHFEELGAFHFDPPGFGSGFQSFPSGHSATAGAMVIIFILLFPKLKWTWIAVGIWVAASRVVVGAHYPSDIVAGFAYGASFAWLLALWFANRRLLFRSEGGLIRVPKTSGLSLRKLYKALHMLRETS